MTHAIPPPPQQNVVVETNSSEKMCYYQVLNVEASANDEQVRKAYRTLALRWHPDRNPDNVDAATTKFKCIQEAYEVLSDKQERAWYDAHRQQILKKTNTTDDMGKDNDFGNVNIFALFSTTAFRSFSDDDEKGFYNVYREAFEQIAQLEKVTLPSFGTAHSNVSETQAFYSAWSNFVTQRAFGEHEKWKSNEAPNRWARRAMEKENEQARKIARKEYNDTIRSLTMYVKKRDRRVIQQQQRDAELEKQRIAAQKVRDAEQAELRKKQRDQHAILEQERLEQQERDLRACYGWNDDFKQEKHELETFECVACKKKFKSEGQWRNHENSKKHKEVVSALKAEFGVEEETFRSQQNFECFACNVSFSMPQQLAQHEKSDKHRNKVLADEAILQQDIDTLNITDSPDYQIEENSNVLPDSTYRNTSAPRKKNLMETCSSKASESDENIPSVSLDKAQSQPKSIKKATTLVLSSEDSDTAGSPMKMISSEAKGSMTRAAKRELRNKKKEKKTKAAMTSSLVCKICNMVFASKNKLFQHLDEFGHAAYK